MVLEKIISIFEEIGLPYRRQGSYADYEQYPDSFFTYWNVLSPYVDFGDNETHTTTYDYMIYLYSKDELEIYTKMDLFINKAKSLGFIVSGKGQDIPTDDKAFVGRAIHIYFREEK